MGDEVLGLSGGAAVVVGAGQGIGRATALLFARAGVRVALVDDVEERVVRVAAEIADLGGEATVAVADVTDPDAASGVIAEAAARLGGLTCVANIVGGASWAPLLEMDADTWSRDFRVNLEHHWYVSRAAARHWMESETEGALVVVASVSGAFAAPRHGAYGAAKAALLSLVRTMSEEWWPRVRVNAVVPGAVRTPRIEAAWQSGDIARPSADTVARMALPEDIAGAALFLASPLAGRVTGQALVVDGGATTRFPYTFD